MAKEVKQLGGGWVEGDTQSFLGLSDAEMALIQIENDLSAALRELRIAAGLSQAALAKRMGSSQSRVAKMEGGDPQVSIDLLLSAVLATGATRADVGRIIAGEPEPKAKPERRRKPANAKAAGKAAAAAAKKAPTTARASKAKMKSTAAAARKAKRRATG